MQREEESVEKYKNKHLVMYYPLDTFYCLWYYVGELRKGDKEKRFSLFFVLFIGFLGSKLPRKREEAKKEFSRRMGFMKEDMRSVFRYLAKSYLVLSLIEDGKEIKDINIRDCIRSLDISNFMRDCLAYELKPYLNFTLNSFIDLSEEEIRGSITSYAFLLDDPERISHEEDTVEHINFFYDYLNEQQQMFFRNRKLEKNIECKKGNLNLIETTLNLNFIACVVKKAEERKNVLPFRKHGGDDYFFDPWAA